MSNTNEAKIEQYKQQIRDPSFNVMQSKNKSCGYYPNKNEVYICDERTICKAKGVSELNKWANIRKREGICTKDSGSDDVNEDIKVLRTCADSSDTGCYMAEQTQQTFVDLQGQPIEFDFSKATVKTSGTTCGYSAPGKMKTVDEVLESSKFTVEVCQSRLLCVQDLDSTGETGKLTGTCGTKAGAMLSTKNDGRFKYLRECVNNSDTLCYQKPTKKYTFVSA